MKNNEIKCIVFDLDGTIFDSEKIWKDTSLVLNKKYNINMDDKFRLECCGRGQEETIERLGQLFPNVDARAVREEWEQMVVDEVEKNGVPMKRGFKSIIKFLKTQNVKLAIATGSSKQEVVKYFGKSNVDYTDIFDGVFSIECVKKGKPDPGIFLCAAKSLNVLPSQCVAIEDSPNGAMAAVNAGYNRVILIPDVFQPTPEAQRNCVVLKNLTQAKEYIQKLLKK